MHKVRIIPTLLYKNNLVKGKKFKSWRVVGNIYQMIKLYNLREVDELIFFDINATNSGKIQFDLIDEIADECFVPLTIGGGVKTIDDIEKLLKVGADKVCINTAAVENLDFVKSAIDKYGSQCIVISIDYKMSQSKDREVHINSGTKPTGISLEEHVKNVNKLNPGEILITSIDHDGEMKGYDIDTINLVSRISNVPLIASGGAGNCEDFFKTIKKTNIKAISAASIFHFTEITPLDVKRFLKEKGIKIRI